MATARRAGLRGRAWYRRLHAHLLSRTDRGRYGRATAPRRRELLAGLEGRVLEIGPGTGPNLRFLPDGVSPIGLEPDPFLHPFLRDEARRSGRPLAVVAGVGEAIPLADRSVDAVVAALVLCSVEDPTGTLAEVCRVLRPGGRFVFLEHVAAPEGSWARTLQRILRGPWRVLADGCSLDRETGVLLESAGFAMLETVRFQAPAGPASPHLAGVARVAVPVAAAVVSRDGRYLVGLRPQEKRHGGRWEFPGGKRRENEGDLEALRRELDEELGVAVTGTGRLLHTAGDPGSPFQVRFVETRIAGDPEAREHRELRWGSPEELSRLPLAPADRRFVEAVLLRT